MPYGGSIEPNTLATQTTIWRENGLGFPGLADTDRAWHVLTTRPGAEFDLQQRLIDERGLPTLLPVYRQRVEHKTRCRTIVRATFPRYLFAQFALSDRVALLNYPACTGILTFDGRMAVVPQAEITALETALSAGAELLPYVRPELGRLARITEGAMAGLAGPVVKIHGQDRFILEIPMLGKRAVVDMPLSQIEIVAAK